MRKIIFLFNVLVFTTANLFAQTINLEQVRTLALANSKSLAKGNIALQSIALDERSRIFSNLPSLSLDASASMGLWSADNAAPINNPLDTISAKANFSVSQKIFDGCKSSIQKAINGIASETARKDALAVYYSVLDSADNAYYAILEASAVLEAEEVSLQSAATSLTMAKLRYENGIINQSDYFQALAEKETRENSRNQARRNLSLAITKLKAITGLNAIPQPEAINFSVYEDLIQHLGNISDADADSLNSRFWEIIAAANPSLSTARLAREQAQESLRMAKTAYSPVVSASFSTGLNYKNNGKIEQSGGAVSLSAGIPLDFWVINNNVQKSKIAKDTAAMDYESSEINIATDLQSSLLNSFSYAGSVLSSRRSLEYAEKNFQYVSERYRLTQSSVTDLNNASSLLITSRNNYINSQYGFLQSLSKLRSLAAEENEAALIKILMGGAAIAHE